MKKMLFALILLLTGCSFPTFEGYEAILNTWLGSSQKDLVMKWGVPSSEYNIDNDTTLLEYRESKVSGYDGNVYTYHCTTTFTVEKGKVTHWKYSGNSCKAYPPEEKE